MTSAEALEASIKHWEENVAAETPDDASITSNDCALCAKYLRYGSESECQGCPVAIRTGWSGCINSPYIEAADAFAVWEEFEFDQDRAAWRAAAQAELDFLKSLREPK